MARRRSPAGDDRINKTEKIDAAIEDAKRSLQEQLNPRRLQGKDLRRHLLWSIILHAFDDPMRPTSMWSFQASPPLSLRMFGGTAARPMVYDVKAERVIELARGDTDVDAVVCQIAADFIERSLTMHPVLRTYMVERLRSIGEGGSAQALRRGQNRKIYSNFCRNLAIVTVVAKLVDRGFNATRSDDGTERECACSIVAAALAHLGIDLTYYAVAKIWTERGELSEPITTVGRSARRRRKGRSSAAQRI